MVNYDEQQSLMQKKIIDSLPKKPKNPRNKKLVSMYLPPDIVERLKTEKAGVSQAKMVEYALRMTYGWVK